MLIVMNLAFLSSFGNEKRYVMAHSAWLNWWQAAPTDYWLRATRLW